MLLFCFSNQTATTDIYTLSLHDALPISRRLDVAREEEVRHLLPGTGRAIGHHAPHRADLEQVASVRCSRLDALEVARDDRSVRAAAGERVDIDALRLREPARFRRREPAPRPGRSRSG